MKCLVTYPGNPTPVEAEYLGLLQDEHDCVNVIVRRPDFGQVLSSVHPSRVTFPPAPPTLVFPSGYRLTAAERECAIRGQRIVAIKSVRERTGFGLRDAKELVDKEVPVRP